MFNNNNIIITAALVIAFAMAVWVALEAPESEPCTFAPVQQVAQ